jgi:hypothetical protein
MSPGIAEVRHVAHGLRWLLVPELAVVALGWPEGNQLEKANLAFREWELC